MRKIFLLLLLLSSACAKHGINYSVLQTGHGTESLLPWVKKIEKAYQVKNPQNRELQLAVEIWNIVAEKELVSFDKAGFPITITYVDELPDPELNKTKAGYAFREKDHCKIYVKNISAYSIILAHEIGHCIGFAHSTVEKSLMAPIVSMLSQMTSELRRLIQIV